MLDGELPVGAGTGPEHVDPWWREMPGSAGDRKSRGGSVAGVEPAGRISGLLFVVFCQDAVLTAVREWEAQNARALREREARVLQEQEQEQLLTYTREDAYNAVRAARPARCPQRGQPACAATRVAADLCFCLGFPRV